MPLTPDEIVTALVERPITPARVGKLVHHLVDRGRLSHVRLEAVLALLAPEQRETVETHLTPLLARYR